MSNFLLRSSSPSRLSCLPLTVMILLMRQSQNTGKTTRAKLSRRPNSGPSNMPTTEQTSEVVACETKWQVSTLSGALREDRARTADGIFWREIHREVKQNHDQRELKARRSAGLKTELNIRATSSLEPFYQRLVRDRAENDETTLQSPIVICMNKHASARCRASYSAKIFKLYFCNINSIDCSRFLSC